MSDFFDNESNESSKVSGEYSYSRGQINQGDSVGSEGGYSGPSYSGVGGSNKNSAPTPKKKKEGNNFGEKLGKAAAIAIVFGLIAGIGFQSVVLVSDKLFGSNEPAVVAQEPPKTEEKPKEESNPLTKSESNTVASTQTVSTTLIDVSDIVDNVMPAIVQVTNVGVAEYQSFFGTYQEEVTSCGSGIIISQDDDYIYIATNNHVVNGAKELTVTLYDDSAVPGTIKGTYSSCDLAVVSVELDDIEESTLEKIKVASIGSSDDAQVGDGCIVIGNALGYGQSVTTGVISAKDREVQLRDDDGNVITNSLIQTDAAVNPGNSGGAMLNTNGEVIGIVSAKLSDASVEGMGYAIPISYAGNIISQMIDNDVVSDFDAAYLGIGGKDAEAGQAGKDSPAGVYVAKVVEDSGAAEAGIEVGDIITSFNGRKVTTMGTIQNALQYITAGTTIEITVAKGNNNYEEVTYEVTLTHKYSEIQ